MSNKITKNEPQKIKQNEKRQKNYKTNTTTYSDKSFSWLLLPVIISMSVLPFLMKLIEYKTNLSGFSWFTYNDDYTDTFLICKQKIFLAITIFMALILGFKLYLDRKEMYFPKILIPLGIYAVLALLSSIVSEYRKFSFSGIHEHFESIFVLLGYCILVYYAITYVKTEKDLEIIINCFVISIIIMGLLGFGQYIGKDFIRSKLGLSLFLPKKYLQNPDLVTFNFEKNRVYLTLYNPNYVGSYAALTAPLLASLILLIRKKLWKLPLYIIAFAGTIVSLIGSQSKTGIIALFITGFLGLILFSKKLIKYFYLTIPGILLVLSIILLYNKANDNILSNQLKKAISFEKSETPSLQDIQTLDDEVLITYKNNKMHVKLIINDINVIFDIKDDFNNDILLSKKDEYYNYSVLDERFPGFEIGLSVFEDNPCFYVNIDGQKWYFTNYSDDGSYYYINIYGKLDKIITAPSAILTGYESYATGRGYIWSRTFPLLKKRLILGSGADTFQLVYPMQDYVNRYNYGYYDQVVTKPHNMYLQIAVQTGVLSLIALIVFYGIYFVKSFRLYMKAQYKSFYSQIGVGIFLSTFCYMLVGIANDSTITVAPIFWAMMGLGIAVNSKVRNELNSQLS